MDTWTVSPSGYLLRTSYSYEMNQPVQKSRGLEENTVKAVWGNGAELLDPADPAAYLPPGEQIWGTMDFFIAGVSLGFLWP